MKFHVKAKSEKKKENEVLNAISSEAEYNALREEKIFRYGYSNSINTTLLTLTLAVFSVGGLLFTMSSDDFWKLAEIFFPLFFLLPSLFSCICFRYLLRNSVRIGLLSEYMRTYLYFQNDISWEHIKKKEKIGYFMPSKNYIGGVEDVPKCITIVSLVFSLIIAQYFIYQELYSDLEVFAISLISLIPIFASLVLHQISSPKRVDIAITITCLIFEAIIYVLFSLFLKEYMDVLSKQAIYNMLLMGVILLTPNFKKEIQDAEKMLKESKIKIQKQKFLKIKLRKNKTAPKSANHF